MNLRVVLDADAKFDVSISTLGAH